MELAAYYGPNFVEDNKSGGVSLRERSRLSFFTFDQPTIIRRNGPVGVTVGFGSQVTLYNNTIISDHTSAGVDLYANSQAYFVGANKIQRNGGDAGPRSANSEAFLRGGEVANNSGPGLLVLVNSSVDFSGVTFTANNGGIITCDNTAVMVSDLARSDMTPATGIRCKTPHDLGNREVSMPMPAMRELSAHKALHEKYRKLTTKH